MHIDNRGNGQYVCFLLIRNVFVTHYFYKCKTCLVPLTNGDTSHNFHKQHELLSKHNRIWKTNVSLNTYTIWVSLQSLMNLEQALQEAACLHFQLN